MLESKIDREKLLEMSPVEWVEWIAPFKKVLPSYATLSLRSGVHKNTIIGVVCGTSKNLEARKTIIDALEEALGELQQAALS